MLGNRGFFRSRSLASKSKLASDLARAPSLEEFYMAFGSCWKCPTSIVLDSNDISYFILKSSNRLNTLGAQERVNFYNLIISELHMVVTKVERACQMNNLSLCIPLLDANIFEFSSRIPIQLHTEDGMRKLLLRKILYKYIPKSMVDRPNKGFSIPLTKWLNEDLREWAGDLLNENRLKQDGYFDYKWVRAMWNAHISYKDRSHHLWPILMFQQWLHRTR